MIDGRKNHRESGRKREGGRGGVGGPRRLTNGGATVERGRGTFALFLGLQIVYETWQSQHQQRRTPKNTPRRDSLSIIHMDNSQRLAAASWSLPPRLHLLFLFVLFLFFFLLLPLHWSVFITPPPPPPPSPRQRPSLLPPRPPAPFALLPPPRTLGTIVGGGKAHRTPPTKGSPHTTITCDPRAPLQLVLDATLDPTQLHWRLTHSLTHPTIHSLPPTLSSFIL